LGHPGGGLGLVGVGCMQKEGGDACRRMWECHRSCLILHIRRMLLLRPLIAISASLAQNTLPVAPLSISISITIAPLTTHFAVAISLHAIYFETKRKSDLLATKLLLSWCFCVPVAFKPSIG